VSSHDSDEVERLGDHVAMMIAGVLEIAEFWKLLNSRLPANTAHGFLFGSVC